MKNISVVFGLCLLLLTACEDSFEGQHKRAGKLAEEYCGCFSSLEGTVSPNLLKLYTEYYSDSLLLDDLVKELTDEEKREHKKLVAAIQDETNSLGGCLQQAAKHIWGTTPHNNDKNSVTYQGIMYETPNCKLASAYIYGAISRVSNAMSRQGL